MLPVCAACILSLALSYGCCCWCGYIIGRHRSKNTDNAIADDEKEHPVPTSQEHSKTELQCIETESEGVTHRSKVQLIVEQYSGTAAIQRHSRMFTPQRWPTRYHAPGCSQAKGGTPMLLCRRCINSNHRPQGMNVTLHRTVQGKCWHLSTCQAMQLKTSLWEASPCSCVKDMIDADF